MTLMHDNPGQGNRGGQEYGEENTHKSQRNQDNQKPRTSSSEEEALKPEEEIPAEQKADDKFSPGEAGDYNPDDFATD